MFFLCCSASAVRLLNLPCKGEELCIILFLNFLFVVSSLCVVFMHVACVLIPFYIVCHFFLLDLSSFLSFLFWRRHQKQLYRTTMCECCMKNERVNRNEGKSIGKTMRRTWEKIRKAKTKSIVEKSFTCTEYLCSSVLSSVFRTKAK